MVMNAEQVYVIQIADRMQPGGKHLFPKSVLETGFASEIAEQGSLEAAVCSCLLGAAYGTYTLSRDSKSRDIYILSRHEPNIEVLAADAD
jgi:hypothetical protein